MFEANFLLQRKISSDQMRKATQDSSLAFVVNTHPLCNIKHSDYTLNPKSILHCLFYLHYDTTRLYSYFCISVLATVSHQRVVFGFSLIHQFFWTRFWFHRFPLFPLVSLDHGLVLHTVITFHHRDSDGLFLENG